MDENYLDNLYNELKSNPKFDFRLDQETFNNKMLNDTNYRDKVYTNVKMFSSNNEFKVDPNTFYTRVLESSKKKSQSEIGSQTTQPGSGSENAQYAFEPGMQEQPTFQGVGKVIEKNLGVKTQSDQDIQAPLTEEGVKELEYRKRIEADKDKYKLASDEQVDEAIRRNPEIASSDKFYEGAVPEIEGIPTTLFGSKTKLEAAQKERDYLQNWDEDFEAAPKQTDLFSDEDIKADPKKYQEAALNDYLEYLKSKNGEDSQTYLGTKEKIDYYKSLGDKLYTDGEYADDLRRFQDIQKTALSKIGNNSYAKALKIQNSYDWDYFSKRASDLELKAQTIQKQINELGVSQGKVLSAPQQKKYEDLLNQYNNIQTEFSKLSEDTKIDNNVILEMNNIQKKMSNVRDNLIKIEDEDTPNAKRVKEYKQELEANKKSQEEFYNTKDSGVLETTGKAVSMIGQKTASSFVSGVFSMYNLPKIAGEAMGVKGYGWTDKMSEAADNINSYVDLYSPQLESGNLTNFMSSMSSLGEGLGSVLTFYTGGSSVSGLAKGLNLSQKSLNIANKAGQFAVASSLSTSQMYDEFLNNGFTPEQASRYALGAGIVMGAAEMIVPEDELLANQLKGSFLSAVKSGATTKEAIENGLKFLATKSYQIAETASKEYTEETIGQLAESSSKQVASAMTGNKIDGIWNVDDFTKSGLAGGGVGGLIELFKFGSKTGKYSNPFEENMVGYLAENYDDMIKKLSESNPEAYDQIADRYGKLKEIYNGLKNTPAFNQLSKADQDHILAQAHTKQVILENIKQSGLDKATFSDQIASIDEDIFLTLNKPKENALQEPISESLLSREQGETTETGGEPQGMGQGVQGEEVTKEGKQEEVSVNREPIAEDIAPEQKAKIEEANIKDEDESVSEVYDFNDEIKSVGTKEQFKAFLRSLSPKGVFSRIAWHNSDKEALQPREGQYYANSRRNAEETYKRDFTHPAIIFGNSPQKMDFDQVQEFDINDVKSQGNDIVITDDLSPAIGAEMNYREFIPSSAEQIIPIGTKENIEAFKAFVEQQKAPEVQTTEQVAEQPTPQVQEEKEPTTEEQTKMEDEAAKSEAMTPKNMKDLIGIYRKVFNLPYPKALVSAMVSNRLIKQMAKRAGVTPEQIYQKFQFQKATEQDLPQGVKMQVDAWHGSPYEFDKFTTEKIGTGEGAQAFGWGLYFTDLKSIAKSYAQNLSKPNINQIQNKLIDDGLSNLAVNDIVDFSEYYDYDYDAIIKALNDNQNFEAVEYLKNNKDLLKPSRSRNLYKVSLQKGKDTDQYTWLEWDKPISNTPISKIDKTILGRKIIESNDSLEGLSPNEQYIQMEVDGVVNALNGERAYKSLSRLLGGDQQASLFLLENGIDGVKYPAESLSRGVTSETARGFNYVVFDENAVSIKEVVKFQKDAEKARGAMMMGMDGQAIIYALTDANVSTPLHELAHVFEHYLTDAEKNQIIKAAKTKGWTTETSEYFARGFEKYLAEGKSSDPIFEKFKQFLLDIYKAIKGSPIDVKLNKQMKDIYAQMLGEDLTAELGEDIEEQETKLEEMEVSEANLVSEYEQIKNMSGIDKIDAMNKWKEKYGELANRYMYIENNYDKLAEQFKAIRTCEFE